MKAFAIFMLIFYALNALFYARHFMTAKYPRTPAPVSIVEDFAAFIITVAMFTWLAVVMP